MSARQALLGESCNLGPRLEPRSNSTPEKRQQTVRLVLFLMSSLTSGRCSPASSTVE